VKKVIHISPAGQITMIHDDGMRELLKQGQASLRRASHVEPGDPALGQDPLQWYADMAPVQGPVLGPFATRTEALASEVDWLNHNLLQAA
jgi:hypothetical protein